MATFVLSPLLWVILLTGTPLLTNGFHGYRGYKVTGVGKNILLHISFNHNDDDLV